MTTRSRLLKLSAWNIGCIGPEGVEIALDRILCLVGKNNAGKSTILRAYELAQGAETFNVKRDRCSWAPAEAPSAIELDVHIPDGLANIDGKWKKTDGDLRILKSRWEWDAGGTKTRTTWDPETDQWAKEGNAGGADNVFKSRLPKPLRIGSLQDAAEIESVLLTLVLSPFAKEVTTRQSDPDSDLAKSIASVVGLVTGLSAAHADKFKDISTQVQNGFAGIFPDLNVRLDIGMAPPAIKVSELLRAGSGIRVSDGGNETTLAHQGTGTRRALFWSMLRVHNKLDQEIGIKDTLVKQIQREKKPAFKEELEKKLATVEAGEKIQEGPDDPALPGYLLLIDEPENALHPLAARAAQRHLYKLAEDPEWQVMLTTHSPYFVNPLADHTTIVRLSRGGGSHPALTPMTYRSETISFSEDERLNLQAIQQMDAGFSEVFFGSYPILVEGDTEHAAFLAAILEPGRELSEKVAIIRARGKAILPALIRMLKHFKVSFSILHDSDSPYTIRGAKNGMWSINSVIFDAIQACRDDGLTVIHRCSLPDFERFLGDEELGKDKPINAYNRIRGDEVLSSKVASLLDDLRISTDHHPQGYDPDGETSFADFLYAQISKWHSDYGNKGDVRFEGSPADVRL